MSPNSACVCGFKNGSNELKSLPAVLPSWWSEKHTRTHSYLILFTSVLVGGNLLGGRINRKTTRVWQMSITIAKGKKRNLSLHGDKEIHTRVHETQTKKLKQQHITKVIWCSVEDGDKAGACKGNRRRRR